MDAGGVFNIRLKTSSGLGCWGFTGVIGWLGCGMMKRLSAFAAKTPMTPHDLKTHKETAKQLKEVPVFKPQKRNKLPRPFNKMGGDRIHSTGMMDVSSDHVAFMYWRNGEILSDRSFYGHLLCRLGNGSLSPIFEFHWHPNHKGVHCLTPCKTDNDYTDRNLKQAPELAIKTEKQFDPLIADDLNKLVILFCKSCGISLPTKDSNTEQLWPQ